MMKNLFYVATMCMVILSCTQDKDSLMQRKTIIAGVVENFSDEANVLLVNYCDAFSDERRFAQNLAESGGRFHATHDYLLAQNITLRLGGKFINLFVNPGDSVFVRIDARMIRSNLPGAVAFSGDNAALNKELVAWTDYGYSLSMPEFDSEASAEKILTTLRNHIAATSEQIEEYAGRTGMNERMKKWALMDKKFVAANYIDPAADRWAVFTDPLFDVFNEANFQTMYFPYHLSSCMAALMAGEPEIGRLAEDGKIAEAMRIFVGRLNEKAPRGMVRDAMLFGVVKNVLDEDPAVWDEVPEIRETFSQQVFVRMLESLARGVVESIPPSATESRLDGVVRLEGDSVVAVSEFSGLSALSRRHEGKVIYIDVWATWCGPCIEEFKSAAALHKYFEGKDVVFVNLCLQSPYDSWQPSVAKYNVGGENYYFDDNASQQFMGEYNLDGFPSYLIVGRGGEVYHSAPRPSNMTAAIERIESLLTQ